MIQSTTWIILPWMLISLSSCLKPAQKEGTTLSLSSEVGAESVRQCSLNSRIEKHMVSLPEELTVGQESAYLHKTHYNRDWYNFAKVRSVITRRTESGTVYVGWQDTKGKIHISRLSPSLKEIEFDLSYHGSILRDFHVDDSSLATFALEKNRMVLRNYSLDGTLKWKKVFTVKAFSKSLHNGRIAKRSDGGYVAYFGVHGNGHESDALQQVNADGVSDNGGKLNWSWGCSHSIDQRLSIHEGKVIPVCVGDYYPSGIAFRGEGKSKVLSRDVKHYNGYYSPNMGGMVEYKDHFVLAISSSYNRNSRDVALVAFEAKPPYSSKGRLWLTNTQKHELKPKITIDGDKLLVFWKDKDAAATDFVVSSMNLSFEDNKITPDYGPTQKIDLEIGPMEDILLFEQGKNVVAARDPSNKKKLLLQEFKSCD